MEFRFGARCLALVTCALIGVSVLRHPDASFARGEARSRSASGEARSRSSCSLPLPMIISTDVDVDDVQAIGYLLNSPVFSIKGIVVEADGWSSQFAGVVNAMRITKRYALPDIPVAFGPLLSVCAARCALVGGWPTGRARASMLILARPPPLLPSQMTSLNGKYDNAGLPPDKLKPNNYLTEFVPLPFNPRPPEWRSAAALIIDLLKK